MRIHIIFNAVNNLIIPFNYNEILQGFIYRHLNRGLSQFIHDHGFVFQKRTFKLFTFSRILGRIKVERKGFRVFPPFSFIVSSPYHELIQSLAENLLLNPEVELLKNPLYVEKITLKVAPPMNNPTTIKMLSALTIYSTLTSADGKKKTYYYHPKEKEFSVLISNNLIKKYIAFYGKRPESEEFMIEPIQVSNKDEKIITYKGFIIKGWMGTYRLYGSEELLKFAYDAGLGAKNSQGFGCFEIENLKDTPL